MIISWYTNQSTRDPEGGDIVNSSLESLEFDIIDSDNIEFSQSVSSHVVEEGVPVFDNATPQSRRYSATVWVSARPIDVTKVEGSTMVPVTISTGESIAFVTPPEGTTRKTYALEIINDLIYDATLVSVEDTIIPFDDYLIESALFPRTVDDAGALVATLNFVEWRTAQIEDTEAPSPRVERGRRRSTQGNRASPTSAGSASTAPAQREQTLQSSLSSLTDYLSNRRSGS